MYIKTVYDIELFIKLLNTKQIEDIKLRYYDKNNLVEIDKISINILKNIKQKFIEYKNLLKILDEEYNNLFDSIKNIDISERYKISINYLSKINNIKNKIIITSHIMSYCYNIIYFVWKKHYDKLNYLDDNLIFVFPKLYYNFISYNLFFNNL